MAAAQYNFTIEQGATFVLPIVKKDGTGSPVDFTSYQARMQVRQSPGAEPVLLEATTENNRLQIDGPHGKVTIVLSALDTEAITWRRGRYDLEMVAPDGTVTRLIEGQITVSREITRD